MILKHISSKYIHLPSILNDLFNDISLYPPQTLLVVGYTVFMSVRLGESLLDFHQTLQTCSYMQDKYLRQKSKG